MMTATGIVALFSLLSAASAGAHGSLSGLLAMLSAMRFLLGVGIGAEYPCGSVSASEQSEEPAINTYAQHRWFALATNTQLIFGSVVASLVPLVLFQIFGDNHLRAVWRLSLGLGVVPALLVFLWRLNMDEPRRYKQDSMKHAKIPYMLVIRRYWVSLSAISFIWFLYDFIVYPFGIYSAAILNNVTGGSKSLTIIFGWNVVISLLNIPGTIGGAFIIDYLGPKNTMITGLVLQAIVGFIMSGIYEHLSKNVASFAVVYGIFLSLGQFGPGNCLGLVASKTSATAIRGQYYGTAAAIGKLGAFIGTWAFPPMIAAFGGPTSLRGNTGPFWVSSGLSLLSALVTFFFTRPLTHDGMVAEDESFRRYLEENGYDTSQMGLFDSATSTRVDAEKSDMSSDKEKL